MPRIFGYDLLGVLASIVAIYAVGFIIYGLLFSELWMSASGYTEDSFAGVEWKMALSPVMPILTALVLAFLNSKAHSVTLMDHVKIGFAGYLGFGGVALLYNWVYSPLADMTVLLIDNLHLFLGPIIGSCVMMWRKG